MALPITKFLDDIREGFENMKIFKSAIVEYFSLKNQMLLELSSDWTSGTKTVPNISKYETIEVFPYASLNGVICNLSPDGVFRGVGGVAGASSLTVMFEFIFNISGDDLTISRNMFSYVAGSNGTNTAQIRRIRGVEPKLPDTLKNILGGGVLHSLLAVLPRKEVQLCLI